MSDSQTIIEIPLHLIDKWKASVKLLFDLLNPKFIAIHTLHDKQFRLIVSTGKLFENAKSDLSDSVYHSDLCFKILNSKEFFEIDSLEHNINNLTNQLGNQNTKLKFIGVPLVLNDSVPFGFLSLVADNFSNESVLTKDILNQFKITFETGLNLHAKEELLKKEHERYTALHADYDVIRKDFELSYQKRLDELDELNYYSFKSEEKYKIIVENQNALVVKFDSNGCLLFVSPQYCNMFGKSEAELIGKPFLPLIHPDDVETVNKSNEKLKVPPYECSHQEREMTVDGWRWFLWSNKAIVNQDGTISEIVAVGKDITAQKKAETALIESELKNRALSETTNEGLVFSYEGKCVECNKAASILFGYSYDEFLGMEVTKLFIEEHRERIQEYLDNSITETYEAIALRKDGSTFWGEFKGNYYEYKGKKVRVGAVRDISDRKKTEFLLMERDKKLVEQNEEYQALNEELTQLYKDLYEAKERAVESDKLKTAFLANMSHEIRTPMNGIIGFSGLLGKEDIDEAKRIKYVEIIQKNSAQLLNIINDIVDISKIEAGQIDLDLVNVNLDRLTADLLNLYSEKARSKNISFQLINKNEGAEVLADENKLKQVFINLIDNAFKFTENGEIVFGYFLQEKSIDFYVKDTGIGIEPQFHQLVFERFRQVEMSSIRKYGGTGLGLSISKAFIEKMGGRIWLESKPGEGSTFCFSLPGQLLRKNTIQEQNNHYSPTQYNWSSKTILIAEDEPLNFHFFAEILEDSEVNLIWVKNGKEAVKTCLERSDIDLVLMDIKMPEMNGYDATREIKKTKPELPIIAQTAYALIGDESKAREAGCDNYIQKPIDIHVLLKLLSKYLD